MSHCIGVMNKITAVKEMWSTNIILEMSLADSKCEVEWYKSCGVRSLLETYNCTPCTKAESAVLDHLFKRGHVG